jgi:rare lipoprotein A
MKKQSKKIIATAFAIWAMFLVPIIAQSVAETGSEIIMAADTAAIVDSLQTQEPPGTLDTPPGETWVASYYGGRFNGRRTASGEVFNQFALTCAHKTLPFQTLLKVTNPNNGKFVLVRVNDRGPFHHGRDIDLSYGAAKELGMISAGVMKVEVCQVPDRNVVADNTYIQR